jgi:hypothetical protein
MPVLPHLGVALLVALVEGPLPAHLRAWSPLLELSEGDKTLSEAIVKVASLTKLAEAVTHKLEIDPKTQALFDHVTENLGTLDPEAMYAIMERTEDGRHAMSVFGELSTKGDYRVLGKKLDRPARFGDLAVTVAMKPARPDSYLLETDFAAHLEVTAREMTGVLGGAMDWLTTTANTHRARTGMDDADRAVGRGLASAFPAMAAMVEKYFEPLDSVTRSDGNVRGRLIGRLRKDAFAKDYPELAELLTEEVKAKARARVTTLDGKTLAVLKIDSDRGEGAVIFEVDPEKWVTDKFRVECELDARLFGLDLDVAKIEVRTSVERTGERLTLRSVFDRTPKVTIGGAALGIVPIAVVDAVIPSNVESIVGAFLTTLARTDKGKGASVVVTLPEKRSEPMRITSRAELLNNGFVSFWLSIASAEIFQNEDVLEEMQRLQEAALAAFASDFDRFQDQAL